MFGTETRSLESMRERERDKKTYRQTDGETFEKIYRETVNMNYCFHQRQ